MWVSSHTPNAPATVPGFRFRTKIILLGFLGGPTAAIRLPLSGQLAEAVTTAVGSHRAMPSHDTPKKPAMKG